MTTAISPSSTSTVKKNQRARTKIVATVGPACRDEAQLAALIEAGVDVFRLNMAHGELAHHEEVLERIRRISDEINNPVGVLVDLAGPKIRLGELTGGQIDCQHGSELTFVRGDHVSDASELVTNYPGLIDELHVNDRVMLVDGTVRLDVCERGADWVRCRVTQPGLIRSRQGVNLPGVKIGLPAMSEDDRKHAVWAAAKGVDFVSLSFVRSPKEVNELKWLLRYHDSHAKVIAKIEKQEAIDQLDEIVIAADGVMVARGDLGVEIDVASMPVVQKQIVAACNRYDKPVIIATQMLDSMQHSRQPSRAEVTDVANAILDGCDACMLSGETAVGEYPRAAVEMMNRIALATEPLMRNRPSMPPPVILPDDLKRITQAVVVGAANIAQELDARLAVVVSHSGASALAMSKRRNLVPIVGVSDKIETLRQMALYWNVIPLPGAPTVDSIQLLQYVEEWGQREGLLAPGNFVVLVAGVALASRGHNMVRVHEIGAG
ncbi:MAG TPA: pyruvate kinase [Pirellulales bacterium]|nr:pyruvate kinase [Pirellulales bacterium]